MSPEPLPAVRIFAGTRAAVRLATALAAPFDRDLRVAVALCGIDLVPRGCLTDFIGAGVPDLAGTAAVIDGLSPFDRRLVQRVRDASLRARIPRLAFRPPAWHRHPLDRWIEVRDLAGAVSAIPSVAQTVLLALPESDIAAFTPVDEVSFAVRMARPPARWDRSRRFTAHVSGSRCHHEAEVRLLRSTRAGAVVMRATGCEADAALVTAARTLDLPIVMIRRPVERGEVPARTIGVAVDWIEAVRSGVSAEALDVPAWR